MLGGNDGFELLSDAFGKIGEKKMEICKHDDKKEISENDECYPQMPGSTHIILTTTSTIHNCLEALTSLTTRRTSAVHKCLEAHVTNQG